MLKLIFVVLSTLCCAGAFAQVNLETGRRYYNYESYSSALPYLQAAAKEGYGEACYLLGRMYYYGMGTEKNLTISERMFRRGLEFGYDKGEIELGDLYFYSYEDYPKALEMYKLAYDNKRTGAVPRIAMYSFYSDLAESIGGKPDEAKAFELIGSSFDEAAWSNDRNVLYLAAMYCVFLHENGKVLDRNKDAVKVACELLYKGRKYYEAACLMRKYNIAVLWCSYMRSQKLFVYTVVKDASRYDYPASELGEMFYIYGMFAHEHNDIDYQMNWGYSIIGAMEKSASYGYVPAMKMLGDWYSGGIHTARNLLKAREWYAKAKAGGADVPEV